MARTPSHTPRRQSTTSSSPSKRKTSSSPTKRKPSNLVNGEDDLTQEDRNFLKSTWSDLYLLNQSVKKKETSNNLVSDLFSFGDDREYLGSLPSEDRGDKEEEKDSRRQEYEFESWKMMLSKGFHIILHGAGSKHQLMRRFSQELTHIGDVIYVEGFNEIEKPAGGALAELVNDIERCLLSRNPTEGNSSPRKGKETQFLADDEEEGPSVVQTTSSSLRGIQKRISHLLSLFPTQSNSLFPFTHQDSSNETPLFIILISPLLSTSLTSRTGLSFLRSISLIPSLSLILTIDDPHRSSYIFPPPGSSPKFIHQEINTFEPYTKESLQGGILGSIFSVDALGEGFPLPIGGKKKGRKGKKVEEGNEGVVTVEGMRSVLKSVTLKAKTIFYILRSQQLQTKQIVSSETEIPDYSIPFDHLYSLACQKFISLTEVQMRTLMGEFRDHGVLGEGIGEGMERRVWLKMEREELEELDGEEEE
jgi:hypothetical protein